MLRRGSGHERSIKGRRKPAGFQQAARPFMKRLCYLHIGLHKTGSTSLQRMILSNVEALARAGVFIPRTSTNGHRMAHFRLSHAFGPGGDGSVLDELREELTEAGRPERILISSEGFENYLHLPETREAIGDYFSGLGYALRVVAYIRPQAARFNSIYAWRTRQLWGCGSFRSFTARLLTDPGFDPCYKLLPFLRMPQLSAIVRPFNEATVAAPIEADFLSAIDLSRDEIATVRWGPPVNATPGARTVAACREIVRLLPVERRVSKAPGLVLRITDALGWNRDRYCGLTPELARLIRRRWEPENQRFALDVWGRDWEDVFAAELTRPVSANEFEPARATPADRAEFKDGLMRILDRVTAPA